MKKVIFTTLVLFFTLILNAQTFGASGLDVKGTFSSVNPVYQTWLRLGNTQNAVIKFRQTPEGINEAMQLTQRLLLENRLDINTPYFYHSVKSNAVNEDDVTKLHESIQEGDTKINLSWFANDGALLHLFLGKNSYEITIMNAYKIR